MPTSRSTVDLSAYPQRVVIYLGMRVNALTGIKTLARAASRFRRTVQSDCPIVQLKENRWELF